MPAKNDHSVHTSTDISRDGHTNRGYESSTSSIDIPSSAGKFNDGIEACDVKNRQWLNLRPALFFVGFILIILLVAVFTHLIIYVKDNEATSMRGEALAKPIYPTAIATTPLATFPTFPRNLMATILQKYLGVGQTSTKVTMKTFRNWANTRQINNLIAVQPKTVRDVQNIVKFAKFHRLKIRVVGTGFSWSPLFPDEGDILLETSLLTRIPHEIQLNEPGEFSSKVVTVTVAAKVTHKELDEFLIKNKLTQLTGVSISNPSVIGTLSTGSHGPFHSQSTLGEYVIAAKIVDGEGNIQSYNVFQHHDEMKAIQTCIGLCGIITEVTLSVAPLETVEVRNDYSRTVGDFNENTLRQLQMDTLGFHWTWMPFTSATQNEMNQLNTTGKMPATWKAKNDTVWLKLFNRIPSNQTRFNVTQLVPFVPSPSNSTFNENVMRNRTIFDQKLQAAYIPLVFPTKPFYYILPEAIHSLDARSTPIFYEVEIIAKEEEDFSVFQKLIKKISSMSEKWVQTRGQNLPLSTVHVRLISGKGSCYLCPNNFDDQNATVLAFEMIGHPNLPGFKEFTDEVWEFYKTLPNIHTAWSRMYENVSNIKTFIKKSYPDERWKAFTKTTARFDPDRMFTNAFLRELLYT